MDKHCNKCNTTKPATDFPVKKTSPDGRRHICKNCINVYNKAKRVELIDQYKEGQKKRYHADLDKFRAEKIAYGLTHKPEKAAYDKVYRKKNAVKFAEAKRKWTERNRHNPEVKLKRNLRRRIHHVLAGTNKAAATMVLLGCTIEEFCAHLEKQFTAQMTWENYGPYGWHVDHKIPCYAFDLTDPAQQKACFHFTNLRPLWWSENVSRPRPKYVTNTHTSAN